MPDLAQLGDDAAGDVDDAAVALLDHPFRTARVRRTGPVRLTATARAQSSGPAVAMGPAGSTVAALFTRMSMAPSSARTLAAISDGAPGAPMSASICWARTPTARTWEAVWTSCDAVRATHATSAPSRASATAVARPMPRPAPVTIATLPSRCPGMMLLRWLRRPFDAAGCPDA